MQALSKENDVGNSVSFITDSLDSVSWLVGFVKGPFPFSYFSLARVCKIASDVVFFEIKSLF